MKIKRVLFTVIMLIVLMFSSINVSATNGDFVIYRYNVKIDVKEDNSFYITETIDVGFNDKRHGIIRSIPLKTNTGSQASITDIVVENHKFESYTESNYLKIKIGEQDKFANQNDRYKISYIYHMGNDRILGYDEFYFNLIGLEWDVFIDNVTFDINMPKEFDMSKLNFAYGKVGSVENKGVEFNITGNSINGKLNVRLNPNEALTVAIELPEGYFVLKENKTGEFLANNYGIVYLVATLFVILFWSIIGRNRRIFPTVEFYAPEGLTPADIGYIYDGEVNSYDITSLIIFWADRGYLRIEEQAEYTGMFRKRKQSKIILHKEKEMEDSKKEYEKEMFYDLFEKYGDGQTVSIDNLKYKFYTTMKSVKNRLYNIWQKDKKNRIYSSAGKPLVFFIHIFSLITATAVGYVISYSHSQGPFWEIIWFALIIGIIMAFPVVKLSSLMVKWKKMLLKNRVGFLVKYMFILLVTASLGMWRLSFNMRVMIITGYITCFCISLFAENSIRRTKVGDSYMEKILGFKDFILHAEKDKINLMVEENPKYYFNVLPYAMVLGITDKWARKFKDIVIEPPDWYKSKDSGKQFNSVDFASTMAVTANIIADSMSSGTTSSGGNDGGGSSDGGEAGGGSGGGGGDDW